MTESGTDQHNFRYLRGPRLDYDWQSFARCECYASAGGVRFVAWHWPQFYSGQDLRDHDFHLIRRECCTQASSRAAAEGKEGVRALARFKESVGVELIGVRPEFGAPVHQVDAWRDCHALRELAACDCHRLRQLAADVWHDGIQAHRLVDHRLEVFQFADVRSVERRAV